MSAPSDKPMLTVRSPISSLPLGDQEGQTRPLVLLFLLPAQHPHQAVAQLIAPVVPVVPIPGTPEEDIDAALAQEIREGFVLLGKPLELARRDRKSVV